jgi:DNA-binding response OmpR family regulator
MSQSELQAAVASLEASTTAIKRQSAALRTQRKYLESIKHQRYEVNQNSRMKRLARQNLTLAVGEMHFLLFFSHTVFAG